MKMRLIVIMPSENGDTGVDVTDDVIEFLTEKYPDWTGLDVSIEREESTK